MCGYKTLCYRSLPSLVPFALCIGIPISCLLSCLQCETRGLLRDCDIFSLEPQLEPHRLEPVVHHAALHGEVVVELVAGVARHVARRVLDGLLTEVRASY